MLVPSQIDFAATVPGCWREAVEHLFFFNPRQGLLMDEIRRAVAEAGAPRILSLEDRIWIGVPSDTLQCLFACLGEEHEGRPIGVVLYGRTGPDTLAIWHLAIDAEHGARTDPEGRGLGVVLIDKVCEVGRRINGISRVRLPYRPGVYLRV
jgi:hypothetical protein